MADDKMESFQVAQLGALNDAINKAKGTVKRVEDAAALPGKMEKQAEGIKKQAEGAVKQGEKTVDQVRELSGNQLTVKVGTVSKEAAAIESRLVAHGFELAKDNKVSTNEAIRLGEFIKGKPGLQGEIRFDEKKNQLVFSKTALETLKGEPVAAKAQAAPTPQAAPIPVAAQPSPAEKGTADKAKDAMDAAKAKVGEAFKDGNCALPWKEEYKTEHCANVRKAAEEKRLEAERNR